MLEFKMDKRTVVNMLAEKIRHQLVNMLTEEIRHQLGRDEIEIDPIVRIAAEEFYCDLKKHASRYVEFGPDCTYDAVREESGIWYLNHKSNTVQLVVEPYFVEMTPEPTTKAYIVYRELFNVYVSQTKNEEGRTLSTAGRSKFAVKFVYPNIRKKDEVDQFLCRLVDTITDRIDMLSASIYALNSQRYVTITVPYYKQEENPYVI